MFINVNILFDFDIFNYCSIPLTLYVAVTQFTYGKLRHCYVKS